LRDVFHKKRKYFLEESVSKNKKDFQDLKKYLKQFGTKKPQNILRCILQQKKKYFYEDL